MLSHEQGRVPSAAAPEHRKAEHFSIYNEAAARRQTEMLFCQLKKRCGLPLELQDGAVQHPAMKFLFPLLVGAFVFSHPLDLRADEKTHRAAAESLLNNMDMDKLMNQSVDQMLQMQVQQNPAIAPYQTQMKAFLSKYMSWASLKDDMVKIYTAEFTEAELKELNAFYQTPLGKKTVQKMPTLLAKGAEMGQKRVQEHLPELQAAIQSQAGGTKTP